MPKDVLIASILLLGRGGVPRVLHSLCAVQRHPLHGAREVSEWAKVGQSCPALCNPHDLYSPLSSPGQNTGVVAFPFSRRSSWSRDRANPVVQREHASSRLRDSGRLPFHKRSFVPSWSALKFASSVLSPGQGSFVPGLKAKSLFHSKGQYILLQTKNLRLSVCITSLEAL